eukprot:gene19711-biopygen31673
MRSPARGEAAVEYGTALGPNVPIDDTCRDALGCATYEVGGVPRRIVFVDGAAAQNADSRFRRAGYGVFFGPGNPDNVSASVPILNDDEFAGLAQGNNKSELMAIVHGLEILARNGFTGVVEFRIDSDYVCTSLPKLEKWREWNWRPRLLAPMEIEHRDLWFRFYTLRAARPHDSVHVVWVKGHVGDADVDSRLATPFNRDGNAAADRYAVAGAALHAVPRAEMQRARARLELALAVQRCMLAIAMARADARLALRQEREAQRNPNGAAGGSGASGGGAAAASCID